GRRAAAPARRAARPHVLRARTARSLTGGVHPLRAPTKVGRDRCTRDLQTRRRAPRRRPRRAVGLAPVGARLEAGGPGLAPPDCRAGRGALRLPARPPLLP